MIQRIQSLFLFAAVVLQAIFCTTVLAHITLNNSEPVDFLYNGFFNISEPVTKVYATTILQVLAWAIAVLSIAAIFLYKKRVIQMRVCIYNLLLTLALTFVMIISLVLFKSKFEVNSIDYTLSFVIPLAVIILLYLAYRGIRKDEILVKGYERLR